MTVSTRVRLPERSSWRHWDTCCIMDPDPSKGIQLTGDFTNDLPLPLGQAIDFESDIFKGKILFRVRDVPSDNPKMDAAYFEGRKRLNQLVCQGQFKECIPMDEVMVGDIYDEPFEKKPPKLLMNAALAFLRSIRPGFIIDLHAKRPRVLVSIGDCQIMRVDKPGGEPDIVSDINIQEDTSRVFQKKKYRDPAQRRRLFNNKKKAKKYSFDTEHIYTFEFYENIIDLAQWKLCVGLGVRAPLQEATQGQPFSTAMIRVNETTEQYAYRFQTFHRQHHAKYFEE